MDLEIPRIVKKGRGYNLLYRGFSYRKDGKSKDGIKQYWRCIQRDGCNGRAHTTGLDDTLLVVFTNEQHEHLPSEELATKSTMKADCVKWLELIP